MADLMIGYDMFFLVREDRIFLLISRNYNLNALFKIRLYGKFPAVTDGTKRSFIPCARM